MSDLHLIIYIALAEWLLHYFPWREYLKGQDLPRPMAYALGVCGFAIPFSVWLYEQGQIDVLEKLWMAIVVAGFAVLIAYGADAVKDLYWGKREANEQVEAMTHAKER